ncbi:MAG: RDD family protein [Acidobacteria bacterium]|nr:RDD family protein [Acidobacteriota bacterium]
MSGDGNEQGEVVLGDEERQQFETAVDTVRRAAELDEPPALTAEDGVSGGEDGDEAAHAEAVDPDALDDPAAWELPAADSSPVAGKPVPAGLWRRIAAAVLDAGVSLAAAGVALLVSELLWLRSGGEVSAPVWVPVLVFFAVGWTHTLAGEGLCAGVTLGKRVLRLRVAGGGGREPALWRVAVRRACLEAVVLAVAALALWFTMVRQYRGAAAGDAGGTGRVGRGGVLRLLREPRGAAGAGPPVRPAAALPARLAGGTGGGLPRRSGGRRGRRGRFERPARGGSCRRGPAPVGRRDGRGGPGASVGRPPLAS